MNKEKTNKQKFNINWILILLCITLIVLAIFIKKPIFIRPIIWIISIIIFTFSIKKKNNLKNVQTIIILISIITVSFFLDGMLSITLKKIPVFSYNIISTKQTRIYNALGVRVWQCNKENYKDLIVDPFYKKGYMCNGEDIETIDSNSFLNSIVQNYNDYKNTYVKINGKISKKTGQNYIEMKPYKNSDITINGYVEFADNITLRIIFNETEKNLDNYDIYDEITIVGVIKNLETTSDKHIIYMYDSKVVSDINLNDYTITITPKETCNNNTNLIYSNDSYNVYTYCLEEIIVSYPDNKYELATSLSSNKISIEELYEAPINSEDYDKDSRKMYTFDNYNVILCDQSISKDIFIGSTALTFNDVICQNKLEE